MISNDMTKKRVSWIIINNHKKDHQPGRDGAASVFATFGITWTIICVRPSSVGSRLMNSAQHWSLVRTSSRPGAWSIADLRGPPRGRLVGSFVVLRLGAPEARARPALSRRTPCHWRPARRLRGRLPVHRDLLRSPVGKKE